MNLRALFGLIALGPALVSASPATAVSGIAVAICSGSGPARTIEIPLPGKPRQGEDNPCCVKGCHSGGNRKKTLRQFDPTQ